MNLNKMPFHIGATTSAVNPSGLPDSWPFGLYFDNFNGILSQTVTPDLLEILDLAYREGQLIGTPLAEDSCGKPYADDFMRFIEQIGLPRGVNALEIGAGVGYLTRRLRDAGFQIVGIEPGSGYSKFWKNSGVDILNDFFPTPRASGPFNMICSYAVLEHIAEPIKFLRDIRNHLTPEGIALFSVPDCTDEIIAGDPSILFHEHFTYFDIGSLIRMIESADMHAVVIRSGFGRCLYAIGSIKDLQVSQKDKGLDLETLASYPERCNRFIERIRDNIFNMGRTGTLGIYCPARALNIVDPTLSIRFFDDDPSLQGKFLPPFLNPIEDLNSLIENPVDSVIVMSRTFGNRIRDNLKASGYQGNVMTINDLF
jgi:SAM-dependent methyltransferase